MPEALDKIRMDLGMDAVILNSKPIKTGGMFGMFGKQQIEVVAAVDEKASERDKPAAQALDRQKEAPTRPQAGTYTAQQAYRKATAAQASVQETLPEVHEQAVSTSQTGAIVAPSAGATGTHDALANEVRDMRQMFQKLLVNDLSQQLPIAIQSVRARLMEQEVSEELSAEIIRQMLETPAHGHEWTEAQALQASRGIIESLLASNGHHSTKLKRTVKYAFFFGPTGVGKTTTIAKLAANSMLKDKRKIGFITADTYRMAAVEQLKTYANILNVPLEVVFSPKEMAHAMERLSDCDLVFVDSAGRNFRKDEYVQGIRDIVQHGKNSVNYLVLSLTSKYNDMRAIIQNFSDVPVKQIIFTKADETQSFGNMLNVSKETGLALSYITTGQNVPDDIMVATPAMVSTMIMGE